MRAGIIVEVASEDRRRLDRIVGDRNSSQKHTARARIILATADGCGTAEIMRRSGLSKPVVWRWQERFMREGVDGLLHDKTRPPGKAPLPTEIVKRIDEKSQIQALDRTQPGLRLRKGAPAR
jgi:transposase